MSASVMDNASRTPRWTQRAVGDTHKLTCHV